MSKAPDNNQGKNWNHDDKSGPKHRITELEAMFESCLKKDMSKKETIEYLYSNANLSRAFTSELWDQLKLRNPELFRALNVRQVLMKQIRIFNELLEKQAQIMQLQSVASTSNSGDTGELRDQQGNEVRNNRDRTLLDNADTSAPGTMKNEKPHNPKKLD